MNKTEMDCQKCRRTGYAAVAVICALVIWGLLGVLQWFLALFIGLLLAWLGVTMVIRYCIPGAAISSSAPAAPGSSGTAGLGGTGEAVAMLQVRRPPPAPQRGVYLVPSPVRQVTFHPLDPGAPTLPVPAAAQADAPTAQAAAADVTVAVPKPGTPDSADARQGATGAHWSAAVSGKARAAALSPPGGTGPRAITATGVLPGETDLRSEVGSWRYAAPSPESAVPSAPTAEEKPQALVAPRDGSPDDLTLIVGVGPKLEALLHKLGVFHFDQIAAWTAAEVAWVDENLEGFKGRVTRDRWVAQASELAAKPKSGGKA